MMTHEEVIEMLRNLVKGEDVTAEEPPTQTEGFESLICEEEFKAILDLRDAMHRYIDVHNEFALKVINEEHSPYQRIQMMLLGDKVQEAQNAILMMTGIHSCNKEFIDQLAEELGYTVKGFEQKLVKDKVINFLG